MAKFRQVHTTFWDDAFVLDLTPEEKYFYLYLMTNNKTTQCGIYELPKRVIEMHTGYNRETVEKLLRRFTEYGKIRYGEDTKEIMLRNWAKYNFINSPKVKACIEKELEAVKDKGFVSEYMAELSKYGYSIEFSGNGIDTVSIDYGEEEEEEKEKEEEKEEEQKEKKKKKTPSPKVDYKSEFDEFWNAYKKKTDKKNAFTKFKLKRKSFSFEQIMNGTKAYMLQCEKNNTETRYIKGPCVFLNGENFNDEYEVVGGTSNNAKNDDAEQFIKINDVPF